MQLHQTFAEIHSYLDKAEKELAASLGTPALPGATVGISFDPDIKLDYVPGEQVEPGFYMTLDNKTMVEVTKQVGPYQVLVQILEGWSGDPLPPLDCMSPGIFRRLFKKIEHTGISSQYNFLEHARRKKPRYVDEKGMPRNTPPGVPDPLTDDLPPTRPRSINQLDENPYPEPPLVDPTQF